MLIYEDSVVVSFTSRTTSVGESIYMFPEEDREYNLGILEYIEKNMGKIDEVIITRDLNTGEETIFGLTVNNRKQLLMGSASDYKILEVNKNPPEEIKNMIYKKYKDYKIFINRNVESTLAGIPNEKVDFIIMLNDNKQILEIYEYSSTLGISLGISTSVSITQNDTEINVILDGKEKIISTDAYKIQILGTNTTLYIEGNRNTRKFI